MVALPCERSRCATMMRRYVSVRSSAWGRLVAFVFVLMACQLLHSVSQSVSSSVDGAVFLAMAHLGWHYGDWDQERDVQGPKLSVEAKFAASRGLLAFTNAV